MYANKMATIACNRIRPRLLWLRSTPSERKVGMLTHASVCSFAFPWYWTEFRPMWRMCLVALFATPNSECADWWWAMATFPEMESRWKALPDHGINANCKKNGKIDKNPDNELMWSAKRWCAPKSFRANPPFSFCDVYAFPWIWRPMLAHRARVMFRLPLARVNGS